MFDMIACYFPITFTATANDPYQISADTLVSQLEDCLCGHYDLLERLLPFLRDKLTHDVHIGRMHALRCLARVHRDFGSDGVVSHHDPTTIADALYDTAAGSRDSNEVDALIFSL